MTKLIKLLQSEGLLEQQVNKIVRLFNKFKAKTLVENTNDDEDDEEEEVEEEITPVKVKKPKGKITQSSRPSRSNSIAESRPANRVSQKNKGTTKRKKMAINAGPVQAGGVNKFETLTDGSELLVNAHSDDIKLDKKLSCKKKLSTRGVRQTTTVLTCRECENDFNVPLKIAEGFDSVDSFICNSCILENK